MKKMKELLSDKIAKVSSLCDISVPDSSTRLSMNKVTNSPSSPHAPPSPIGLPPPPPLPLGPPPPIPSFAPNDY